MWCPISRSLLFCRRSLCGQPLLSLRRRLLSPSRPYTSSRPTFGATDRWTVTQGPADAPDKCTKWNVDEAGIFSRQVPVGSAQTSLSQQASSLPSRFLAFLAAYLMPQGYPNTVAPSYTAYATWTGVGMMFSSVAGVLSMQSLLYAVGLGAGAVPLAAAVNWILKDGLGQMGGVICAALINNRFDADPKMWRFAAALAQDLACLLECLTPLAPGAFLPIAALANVGKNISWLAASATRAGLHQTQALRGNLADVTAKAGSQTIAASTAGTILGVALSPLIGTEPQHILAAFALASAGHLFCLHRGLRAIVLPTINGHRLQLAAAGILASVGSAAGVGAAHVGPTTEAAINSSDNEGALAVAEENSTRNNSNGGDETRKKISASAVCSQAQNASDDMEGRMPFPLVSRAATLLPRPFFRGALRIRTPKEVAALDVFTPWERFSGVFLLFRRPWGATLKPSQEDSSFRPSSAPTLKVIVGPPLELVSNFQLFHAASNAHASNYIVAVQRTSPQALPAVQLLLLGPASWRDVIVGYLHAVFVALHVAAPSSSAARLSPSEGPGAREGKDFHSTAPLLTTPENHLERTASMDAEAVSRGGAFVQKYGHHIIQDLELAGWWVGQPLLERMLSKRITIAPASQS